MRDVVSAIKSSEINRERRSDYRSSMGLAESKRGLTTDPIYTSGTIGPLLDRFFFSFLCGRISMSDRVQGFWADARGREIDGEVDLFMSVIASQGGKGFLCINTKSQLEGGFCACRPDRTICRDRR